MSRPLVTVKTLIAESRDKGEIIIARNAIVTPAAADWLRDTRVPVRYSHAMEPVAPSRATTFVVADAANPNVQTIIPRLEREYGKIEFLPCQGYRAGLLKALNTTCVGLAQCDQRLGIVLVDSGALCNCVANKHSVVRAAIAKKPSDLWMLMREMNMNMLILEHGQMSLSQMNAMIDTFLTGTRASDPVIDGAINGTGVAQAVQPAAPGTC